MHSLAHGRADPVGMHTARLGAASTMPSKRPRPLRMQLALIMTTTLENLRTRKLQLEQHSRHALSEQEREQIEGELMRIEIALSFLDHAGGPAGQQTRKPPLG